MKRYHLDANVLLRFLRNDDAEQSPAAKKLVEAGKTGQALLSLSPVTVAEVFYALRTAYRMPRQDAAKLLSTLLRSSTFELEHEGRVLDALQRVERCNVDFGDGYLAATAVEAAEAVASFDQDFKKFSDLSIHVP